MMQVRAHDFLFAPFTNSKCGTCGREELNHVHLGISDDEREEVMEGLMIDYATSSLLPMIKRAIQEVMAETRVFTK